MTELFDLDMHFPMMILYDFVEISKKAYLDIKRNHKHFLIEDFKHLNYWKGVATYATKVPSHLYDESHRVFIAKVRPKINDGKDITKYLYGSTSLKNYNDRVCYLFRKMQLSELIFLDGV
jgi:hypothetical protein